MIPSDLENDLKFAIERQEFFLTYQPIFDLSTQEMVGMEALLRWEHPQSGFISPDVFIYSPRPGTPAASLPDDVPMEVKKQRLTILQNRILLNIKKISESMVGKVEKILVLGTSKKRSPSIIGTHRK